MAADRILGAVVAVCATVGLACGASGSGDLTPATLADRAVREALASPDAWLRAETVRLIGDARVEPYRDALERALDDPSAMVQTAAVEALLRTGVRSVEDIALNRLVSGTEAQREQLLDLVVAVGRPAFRDEMITRGLRDVSPAVRIAALDHATDIGLELGLPELQRLLTADEPDVSAKAFLALAHFDRASALDLVLSGLHSTDRTERARALGFARHIPSSSLWPMMRSYALAEGDAQMGRLALLVLGHVGDPIAEEGLRDVLLSPDPVAAADALGALSHIPTPRAYDQPLVHRRDARPLVRRTAMEEMIRQRRPSDDFEPFLEDSDPDIARDALLHMQQADPERAAALFARVLEDASEPLAVLTALYRVSQQHDIRAFLGACGPLLTGYVDDDDPHMSGLAVRLLAARTDVESVLAMVADSAGPDALYALIEASFEAPDGQSALYAAGLQSDVHAVRVAASLGVVMLGDAYEPPTVESVD